MSIIDLAQILTFDSSTIILMFCMFDYILFHQDTLFVFFFVFSDYGRVLCTNKRLYIRLSRTGSRKT